MTKVDDVLVVWDGVRLLRTVVNEADVDLEQD